jgi:hypothetical protein
VITLPDLFLILLLLRVSSDEWFEAGIARQRVGPTLLGIAPPRVYDSE